jgi:hypothetical protein
MDAVSSIASVCPKLFCLFFAGLTRFSDAALRKSSMESALEDSRGASPCLVGGCGTFILYFSSLSDFATAGSA